MNSTAVRTAIASMVLGIVSVSLCVPAILLSFFWWLLGMITALASLTCGILAIVMSTRASAISPAGRAVAGLILGIIGTSIAGLLLLCLLLLRIIL
ncbi:hypothetical protein MKC91_06285 [[Clostridium] innocuum]|nr:hypothetical protein [Erysipelotrichaceae bacterium]MCR0382483.1 hypothetical protein [[Clostridium] innocuum]MCR0411828.1 hypothetical protein [[Clostridium] innocuum]MCR0532999.1 hypothetical protein [[Clostridium] innocuum]MCR0538004.1 hypothetical protein [[Clostridium] innocuum]